MDFEPPKNYYAPDRYIAGLVLVPNEAWNAVPNVVANALAQALGPDVPIDPQIAFRYFKNGRLPEFVVCYFMWFQMAKRLSKATIFFRAFHYLEAFREFSLNAAGAMEVPNPPQDAPDDDQEGQADPSAEPEAKVKTEPAEDDD